MDQPCEFLPWDSEFFGHRIARVVGHRLDPDLAEAVMAFATRERIDCLYFLADSDDVRTVRTAEDSGFRLVDVRVTLERFSSGGQDRPEGLSRRNNASGGGAERGHEAPPAQQPPAAVHAGTILRGNIRASVVSDIPALEAIARTAHRDSRFYADPGFPDERCDALYETWIRRSCEGWADLVLVAEVDGRLSGYVTCHLRAPGRAKAPPYTSRGDAGQARGQIGLVGVSTAARGRGLGRAMIEEALGWFVVQGVTRVTVVTQGRNIAAQRLYQGCGFQTQSMQLWYHWWPHSSLGAGLQPGPRWRG